MNFFINLTCKHKQYLLTDKLIYFIITKRGG